MDTVEQMIDEVRKSTRNVKATWRDNGKRLIWCGLVDGKIVFRNTVSAFRHSPIISEKSAAELLAGVAMGKAQRTAIHERPIYPRVRAGHLNIFPCHLGPIVPLVLRDAAARMDVLSLLGGDVRKGGSRPTAGVPRKPALGITSHNSRYQALPASL